MKGLKGLLSVIIALLILVGGIKHYKYVKTTTSAIKLKNEQISQLEKLHKLDTALQNRNNTLLKLNEETISRLREHIELCGKKEPQESVTAFKLGEKTITLKELLTIFNNTYKENEHNKQIIGAFKKHFGISWTPSGVDTWEAQIDSNSLIIKCRSELKAQDELIKKLNKKLDTLQEKEFILNFLQRRYKIPYTFDGKTITVPYNRLDTLIDIYPLLKNRIKINEKKGTIIIKGLL